MKTLSLTLFLAFISSHGFTQKTKLDSLKHALKMATTDADRHNIYIELNLFYAELNLDSALFYTEKRLQIAKQNNYKLAEAHALTSKGYQNAIRGRYAASFQNLLLAFKIAKDPKSEEKKGWRLAEYPIPGKGRLQVLANAHQNFSALMRNTENIEQEIIHLKESLRIVHQINDIGRQMFLNMNLAQAYLNLNQIDSALYFAKEADAFSKNPAYKGRYRGLNISRIGDVYLKKGDKQQAKKYYYEGLFLSNQKNNKNGITQINHKLIQLFLQENEKDSALIYAVKNLGIIKSISNESLETNTGSAYEDVYLAYKLNNKVDSTYKYQGFTLTTKDSLYKIRIKNLTDFQSLSLQETMRLENLEKDKIQTQSKIRTYSLLSVLAVLSIIGFILYVNNRQKQRANIILKEQKEEINNQKEKVEKTLTELKSTQAQLIQSEKLASLGELTAGIAHEIQNPLNFVNNFSELSVELAQELKDEVEKLEIPEKDKEYITEIIGDLSQNQAKINQHGKRASGIVSGMLEHSRTSTGERVLTDINKLADEYLRLSYHGIRAKDNSFNANYELIADENLPKIEVIPQDMRRVLLNLINNAFWAVKTVEKPLVVVRTEQTDSQIIIKVSDNGIGIPDAIKEKIFQPFFTTKPTGQGTGLGLSLSFDIVKAHGGELKVETKEGEGMSARQAGSKFIIQIPIN